MNSSEAPNLILEPPDELIFQDKLGHIGGVTLLIKNKNMQEVYFKVKSTATKFYAVRPSTGIIKPHSQSKVIVQPRDDNATSLDTIDSKKHRFLVQSAYVGNQPMSPENFWKETDMDSSKVATAKLRAKVFRIQPATITKDGGKIAPNALGENTVSNTGKFATGGNSTPIGVGVGQEMRNIIVNENEGITDSYGNQPETITKDGAKIAPNALEENIVSNAEKFASGGNSTPIGVGQEMRNIIINEGINDSYGHYVAKVLDNLSAKKAIMLKKEMNELIAKYEEQEN